MEDEVPLAECATLAVLPGKADRNAFGKERSKRQRLGLSPVDPAFVANGSAPTFELALKFAMSIEALRHGQELLVDQAQRFV